MNCNENRNFKVIPTPSFISDFIFSLILSFEKARKLLRWWPFLQALTCYNIVAHNIRLHTRMLVLPFFARRSDYLTFPRAPKGPIWYLKNKLHQLYQAIRVDKGNKEKNSAAETFIMVFVVWTQSLVLISEKTKDLLCVSVGGCLLFAAVEMRPQISWVKAQ